MEKTIKMRKVEVVEKRGKACPRSTRKKGRRGWEKSIELITIGPELKWDLYYFVMKTEYERRSNVLAFSFEKWEASAELRDQLARPDARRTGVRVFVSINPPSASIFVPCTRGKGPSVAGGVLAPDAVQSDGFVALGLAAFGVTFRFLGISSN